MQLDPDSPEGRALGDGFSLKHGTFSTHTGRSAGPSDQELANSGPWARSSPEAVSVNGPLALILSQAAFGASALLGSFCRDWPTKPKISPVWPFVEKVCRPLLCVGAQSLDHS